MLHRVAAAGQQEDDVLAVWSELHLQVLLGIVEEESLDHLVLPELPVGLAGLAAGRGRVAVVRGADVQHQVRPGSGEGDLGGRGGQRLPVPCLGANTSTSLSSGDDRGFIWFGYMSRWRCLLDREGRHGGSSCSRPGEEHC